jgi:hypothetical protein
MAQRTVEKMAGYRARLRARGLRPVELWVHDTRDPEVQARLRREAELVRGHASTRDGNAFLDAALAEIDGWEP